MFQGAVWSAIIKVKGETFRRCVVTRPKTTTSMISRVVIYGGSLASSHLAYRILFLKCCITFVPIIDSCELCCISHGKPISQRYAPEQILWASFDNGYQFMCLLGHGLLHDRGATYKWTGIRYIRKESSEKIWH